jgi:A/G-specific adenine glycosylase
MTELPGTPWRPERWTPAEALAHAPMPAAWRAVGEVRHGFTHFELHLALYAATVTRIDADGFLRDAAALEGEALPSLMRKCVRQGQLQTHLRRMGERSATHRCPRDSDG